jgi:nitrogen fixation-related uncharacterized protein
MFYIGWIALTATGIIASIAVLMWAIRAGQFADQGRARYLPLADERPSTKVVTPARRRAESYALLGIIAVGLLAIAFALILTVIRVYT